MLWVFPSSQHFSKTIHAKRKGMHLVPPGAPEAEVCSSLGSMCTPFFLLLEGHGLGEVADLSDKLSRTWGWQERDM